MTSSSANDETTGDGPTAGETGDRSATRRTAADEATDDELSQLRERAAAIRDEEVARACSQLAARGDLTPEQRAAVADLADRLVEDLLAVPARGLRAAEETEAVAETVRDLFLE